MTDSTWSRTALKNAAAAGVLFIAACSGGGSGGDAPVAPVAGGGSGGGTGGGGTGGGGTSNPTPTPVSPSAIDDQIEAARFLTNATFGPDNGEMQSLVGRDAAQWIQSEFAKSPTLILPQLLAAANAGEDLDIRDGSRIHWKALIGGDDQLRQRVAYALSQIMVVSDRDFFNDPEIIAYYQDILAENAFGNYRDLLEAVTYSPAMGRYLTYLKNRKGDPSNGRVPDENYAREVMQLFTIGVLELNQDGSLRLDGSGNPIETYDNLDVTELAKVFTGLSYKGASFYNDHDDDRNYSPMVAFDEFHSDLEKAFLGTVIPANTPTTESIDIALDTLVDHPNTAPYVGRQLIQRLVTSNPSAAYVGRVSAAFAAGQYTLPTGGTVGDGRRGDLQATIAAVLLDEEAFLDPTTAPATYGKIREPVIRFVHWARAFDVDPNDALDENYLGDMSSPSRLAQQPFKSPSVFNFYRPGYIAPGSATGEAGVTAPELQILNESTAIGYTNIMSRYIRDDTPKLSDGDAPSFEPNYSDELALADDPAALAAHLNDYLTQGRMDPQTISRMEAVLAEIPIDPDDPAEADEDRLTRVEIAVMMTITSPAFITQR